MTRVIIHGAAGRMGHALLRLTLASEEFRLVGAVDRQGHPDLGRDTGLMTGNPKTGIPLSAAFPEPSGDREVVIDFSDSDATDALLRNPPEGQRAMVIGTTGLSGETVNRIKQAAKKIPCVFAPNMSIGVNVLFKTIEEVAKRLGPDYDIEIQEAHHRYKKDAPSGTAMKMAQIIADALGRDLDRVANYGRKGLTGERGKNEIGIQSIRAGEIIGDHTALFAGIGERLEITHRAQSRDNFARGALEAAKWAAGQPPGLYDMLDVLGLKEK